MPAVLTLQPLPATPRRCCRRQGFTIASLFHGSISCIVLFTKSGKVDFACLQPGHYDAGMKGLVNVAAGKGAANTDRAVAVADMSDGEVRKIDKDSKKITLKHGDIKNLDMPGMTMVFQVKDAAMLESVKPGDKVKFKAEKSGSAFMLTDLQVIR